MDALPDDHHEEGDDNKIASDDESCDLGPEVSSNSSVDWLEHNNPDDDPISLQQEHAYTSTGAEPVTEKVLTTTKQREKLKAKFGRVKASDEYTQNDDVKPVATSITHAIQDGIIAPPLNEPTKEHRSSTASTSGGGVQLVMLPIPKDHQVDGTANLPNDLTLSLARSPCFPHLTDNMNTGLSQCNYDRACRTMHYFDKAMENQDSIQRRVSSSQVDAGFQYFLLKFGQTIDNDIFFDAEEGREIHSDLDKREINAQLTVFRSAKPVPLPEGAVFNNKKDIWRVVWFTQPTAPISSQVAGAKCWMNNIQGQFTLPLP
jgi:hypothetical protein